MGRRSASRSLYSFTGDLRRRGRAPELCRGWGLFARADELRRVKRCSVEDGHPVHAGDVPPHVSAAMVETFTSAL